MYKLYRALSIALAPFLKIYFYVRCLYGKDRIESVKNHFGVATAKRRSGKLVWVHAASVGESLAALTFIRHLKEQFKDVNVLLTTVTVTSADILASKITSIDNCCHQFSAADNPFWVKKFLDYWKVDTAVFLESEIWPNTIQMLHDRRIPTFLLSSRLSPRSFRRWKSLKNFFTSILKKFDCILAQSEVDMERYAFFSPRNTKRIDNLKYANAVLPSNETLLNRFKKLRSNRKVLVAASTHEKEEDIIIEAHKKLKSRFDLITIIIPRHTVRVKSVCALLKKHHLSFSLRSEIVDDSPTDSEVFCVDTFGEVGTFFRLADLCFVGGSLVPVGGHNIYEPVALGKPVMHGPFMDNALEVRDFLREKNVAFEVKDADEIVEVCADFFSHEKKLRAVSKLATSACRNESLKQIDEIMQLERFLK
ncbi:MAG: 3-deoxy-D-manno-octulosonic acid transferase [Holosporaceae bacterium]|jgi:3-deoxy-D-manno-octulosonic-acid transferase|nr:3-deoxy-D-manno-octulosonic acid transferase [Holosporaceae bacterium]